MTRTPKQVHLAWPVGHESSGSHEITGAVDHRQSRAEREGKNAVKISDDKLVDHDIERICLRVELLEHGAMSCMPRISRRATSSLSSRAAASVSLISSTFWSFPPLKMTANRRSYGMSSSNISSRFPARLVACSDNPVT